MFNRSLEVVILSFIVWYVVNLVVQIVKLFASRYIKSLSVHDV